MNVMAFENFSVADMAPDEISNAFLTSQFKIVIPGHNVLLTFENFFKRIIEMLYNFLSCLNV
ncbi:hypothetical protein T4B_14713 [Trichinella pseudospiralis]|uniref:Uncharacterized protein n=1 Tax=Trichinella pseudospiralis TaxID=6337 RepID=A0A0V1EM86_TRIPS|nr:hypothetical protein T4A_3572 [Trichinella pseudospiralis]KRZ35108.1 hypothetical protein T4B_14713 [Trichinella pseudospiralis]KRZ43985.1 hypothetical protein T4C_7158 [Trichinella pseudospiralis]